jgi:hypothetical protein
MSSTWLLDILAALMPVVAPASATRFATARLPAIRLLAAEPAGSRSSPRGSGGADTDNADLVMCIIGKLRGSSPVSCARVRGGHWEQAGRPPRRPRLGRDLDRDRDHHPVYAGRLESVRRRVPRRLLVRFQKIVQSTPIVADTEQLAKRRDFSLKSRAQISDGPARRLFDVLRKNLRRKINAIPWLGMIEWE